jgi:Xaa-Pro aminopeptidase
VASSQHKIEEAEFRQRIERVRSLMDREGLEALIAFASRGQHGCVRYLTGFEPWLTPEQWAFSIVTDSDVSLITNSPWDFAGEEAQTKVWVSDVLLPGRRREADGVADSPILAAWAAVEWCDPILERLPSQAERIGIAGWHSFPISVYEELRRKASQLSFSDATFLLRELRAVKSPAEVDLLANAGRIADAAGAAFLAGVKPGVSEREVTARVDTAMMLNGTEQLAYWTNLAAGPRTLASCFLPTGRAIGDGELVQLDCGPMVEGYKADFSRVTIAGPASGRALRLVETVAAAFEACAAALKPGVECAEVARVGLDVVRQEGYTNANLYLSPFDPELLFMAHGIGLENPDPPGMLTLKNHSILREGMVINLEPIILDREVGGARIEGAYVIGESGATSLSQAPIRPWLSA